MTKYLLLTVIAFITFSCSSDDDDVAQKDIPESFDIKIEIEGKYRIPKAIIFVNSRGVERWDNIELPFTGEYTYDTSGDEITRVTTACNCITISAWASLSKANEMEVFNLYIDGELVDSTTITNDAIDNIIDPTRLEFVYSL